MYAMPPFGGGGAKTLWLPSRRPCLCVTGSLLLTAPFCPFATRGPTSKPRPRVGYVSIRHYMQRMGAGPNRMAQATQERQAQWEGKAVELTQGVSPNQQHAADGAGRCR
jgi:hypothetical protein